MDTSDEIKRLAQERFHFLGREEERIRAASAADREAYAALNLEVEALLARQREVAARFKAIEAPLFDLCNERGRIARFLDGKTGEAPAGA